MFRLMIVEDEPIVLEGMLRIINFQDLGFDVVCACTNGSEALQKFSELKPDVVITDICMDLMDGLEFIERASEQNHRAKFIIVSGHQDFKFVKKALSLKVLDYILKPVTAKEFRELLTKIADELNEKSDNQRKFDEIQKSTDELRKSIFLNELMNLKLSEDEIKSNLTKYSINLNKKYFQVSVIKMNDLHTQRRMRGYDSSNLLLNDVFYKVVSHCSEYESVVSFVAPQGYVIVIVNDDKEDNIGQINIELLEELSTNFPRNEEGGISCYAGNIVQSVIQMSDSYAGATKLIKNGILKNSTDYYDANYILNKREEKTYSSKEDIEEWTKNIIYTNITAYHDLKRIIDNLRDASYLLSDYRVVATSMVDRLLKEFSDMKIEFANDEVDFESFDEAEITSYLNELTKRSIDEISKESNSKESYIINKALVYIHENYGDYNLDLQSVCKHLDISISYFSLVFKKNTNMTFIKYINNYRIDKAKYFLEHSQRSISDVSEMVGYVDPHYFGIVFKKHVEITPKKYRGEKRVGHEEL